MEIDASNKFITGEGQRIESRLAAGRAWDPKPCRPQAGTLYAVSQRLFLNWITLMPVISTGENAKRNKLSFQIRFYDLDFTDQEVNVNLLYSRPIEGWIITSVSYKLYPRASHGIRKRTWRRNVCP